MAEAPTQISARSPATTASSLATTKKKAVPPLVSAISGAVAGGCEAAVTYPFEFAKTRLQLRGPTAATSNPLRIIKQVVAHEGIASLYVGCSTLVIGTALKAGVRFLSFDTVRNALADEAGKLSLPRSLAAGMVAGVIESVAAVTPTERIKTALIDDSNGAKRFKSGFHASSILIRENGIGDMYKGLAPTAMKQCATSGVRMGTYLAMKQAIQSRGFEPNSITTFLMGGIAGTVTVYATQPFDTIKSRTQAANGTTTTEAWKGILVDAGIRGFWKGSTMRLGRLVFSGGIVFTIYEKVANILTPMLR